MTRFVSLFRGINVGGRQMIRMNELTNLYETLGFKDVVTYIQSGNVVCTSDEADVAHLSRHIEGGFAQKFGFHVHVMIRTSAEFHEIIAHHPFQNQHMEEPKWVIVLFLATRPDRRALEELQKAYVGPEELCLIGQEVYIYYPTGIGRSKLTLTLLEKKLQTIGTARNWNTILHLQKLI